MSVNRAGECVLRVQTGLRAAKSAIATFCSICSLAASDGVAQTVPDFVPDQDVVERWFSDTLETAYLAIERDILAGNLERARAALLPLLAADPDAYQARFLLAEIERRSGHLDVAIAIYREILAASPTLGRVRLELAITLIAAGKDADAERELFRVLRDSPPGPVTARIRNVLAAIDQRRSVVWSGGLSVIGDSNANAAPRDRSVTIFGLPFDLSDESREHSGFGLSAFAAAEWRRQLNSDLRLRLGGALFALDYQGIHLDQTGASTTLGPQFLRERWNASVLLVGSARGYGGEPYSSSYGLRAEAAWSPQERIALQIASDFQYASYAQFGAVSGNQWSLEFIPAFAFRPNLAAWLTIAYAERDSRSSFFAYQSNRFGLGGRFDTNRGITLSAEIDAIPYEYQGVNPLFAVTQHDTLAWSYISIAAPRFTVLNLVPRIMLNYSKNFSNIAVYRYERASVEFSFVRRY